MTEKDILFIAPIPPPINGQSKASKVLLDALCSKHNVEVIDLSKTSLKSGTGTIRRLGQILAILTKIARLQKDKDVIYLSLSESCLGNLRDIAIYKLCNKVLNRMYVHMLGGAGMRNILNKNDWQSRLNAKYLNQLAGIIVEGPVNFEMFRRFASADKIHVVPNFAEDYLFLNNSEIEEKFSRMKPLNVLFLSNLIPGKGYWELAEAYIKLNDEEKQNFNIKYVGAFESEKDQIRFLKLIEDCESINYLGPFIDGNAKRNLYKDSHIFCLPSYYPFEGQPISILEAYASGCVVVTTDHSGIPFVFKDRINGYMVQKKSVHSLVDALRRSWLNRGGLQQIAFTNRNEAITKYRTDIYMKNLSYLFD